MECAIPTWLVVYIIGYIVSVILGFIYYMVVYRKTAGRYHDKFDKSIACGMILFLGMAWPIAILISIMLLIDHLVGWEEE